MDKLTKCTNHYKLLIHGLLPTESPKYFFTNVLHHQKLIHQKKIAEANRNYVREIIFRFHAAALITLRRNLAWIESIEISRRNSQLFAFCSSLRDFIEAAADSFYSLEHVPQNLAHYFDLMEKCIKEDVNEKIHLFKDLEDWGLHFMEAGKNDDEVLNKDHFKARRTWEYINKLDSDRTLKPVYSMYQKLSQMTHPSRETTYLFFRETDNHFWSVQEIDEAIEIKNIINAFDEVFEDIFQKSFNSALIVLWIIDSFSLDELKSPEVRRIDFSEIPEFLKIVKNISSYKIK